jgi:phosphohistidine phosphatase
MDVYLVQHGEAVSEEQNPQRQLSDEGRKVVMKVGKYVAALGGGFVCPLPSQVWHSGKLRAQQTAEILARELAPNMTPVPHRNMKPKDDPAAIGEELRAMRDQPGAVLLVGHLPHLARLAGLLLAGDADRMVVELVNAGIVKLRPAERGWTLAGYITPGCVR